MPSEAHIYENTTELGEDRVPAPAPSVEFLADLGNHLNISQHATPPVFTEACNDLCRFGYDHPDVVGTGSVLESLFMALKYRPDNDDEDEGVLKVPIAAIKALAVLTSSPIVRGRLNGVSEALPAVLALLQLPYATTDVRTESLTTLTNACCSRPLALEVGRQPLIANITKTLVSPPCTVAVQSRALSLATHLVSNVPAFAQDFAREGAVDALATILAAPGTRASFITQNRAALLLAAMARYPDLNTEIAEAAKNAPALREAAAKAAAMAAAATKTARLAMEDGDGSEEDEEDDEEGSEEGSEEEGEDGSETDYEADGQAEGS